MLLEVDRPRAGWLAALHSLHFDRVVPRVGAWLSDAEAYRYLPRSTVYLPPGPELLERIAARGFGALRRRALGLGAAQLIEALRGRSPVAAGRDDRPTADATGSASRTAPADAIPGSASPADARAAGAGS